MGAKWRPKMMFVSASRFHRDYNRIYSSSAAPGAERQRIRRRSSSNNNKERSMGAIICTRAMEHDDCGGGGTQLQCRISLAEAGGRRSVLARMPLHLRPPGEQGGAAPQGSRRGQATIAPHYFPLPRFVSYGAPALPQATTGAQK